MSERVGRGVAALAAACLVAVGVAGCGGAGLSHAPEPEKRGPAVSDASMRERLGDLRQRVDCHKVVDYESDSLVFDPAVGFDCIMTDGSAVMARVYQHASTVPKVLQEWAPTIGTYRWWTRGSNWFVAAPEPYIERFASAAGATTATKETPSVVGVEPQEAARDTCVGFVSSAAADRLLRPDAYEESIGEIDERYPGARKAIVENVTPGFVAEHEGELDYEITGALSRFGAAFREVCRHVRF